MIDILITNGVLITMDPARRIIEKGAIAIDKGCIVEVGQNDDLIPKQKARKLIDANRKVVMPGLIDGHGHAGHGLVKTLGGDR